MFRHLFKITLRNLFKTKLHSFINILGLSLGIACTVLIILFVKDELTFDNFHSNKEDLYRLYYNSERMDGTMGNNTVVPMIMGPTLIENYSEIKYYSVWHQFREQVKIGEDAFEEQINMASPDFFNMFDFELVTGQLDGTLEAPTDVVITREIAQKFFADQDPVGQLLRIPVGDGERDLEIKAVVENVPSNSSLRFDIIISNLLGKDMMQEEMLNSWNFVFAEGYVMLEPGTDSKGLESRFPDLIDPLLKEDRGGRKYEVMLQPLTDIHLNRELAQGIAPVSDVKYTLFLSGISLLILSMACINFMNLSLGRSLNRAREIGIKKVVGAIKMQLVTQFLAESVILSIISLFVGATLAYLVLPTFNELAGKELSFDFGWENTLLFLGLSFLVGLLAGFYPAVVMSGFRPVSILKGSQVIGGGKQTLRMIMITFQLVLSIFLITSAIFMKNQLGYIQNKNLGFNKEQVLVAPMTTPGSRGLMDALQIGLDRANLGQPEVRSLPAVEDVAISSHTFGRGGWIRIGFMDENQNISRFFTNTVDAHFIDVLDMEIVEGRGFQVDNESDNKRSIVVNEAFVKQFGLESPIGDRIPHDEFMDHEIIGVVKDFHFSSLHNAVEPLVLTINPMIVFSGANDVNVNSSFVPKLFIKLKAGMVGEGLDQIREKWGDIYPGDAFNYEFMDDAIQAQYEREANLDQIITFATVLSILIGSLGLFGLATLTMSARIREMSIRKIFGADQGNLIITLSRSYLLLVLLATVISLPITYLFISDWLKEFTFKIDIGVTPFILGFLIIFGVSALTLTYQSVKIAFSKPIDNLRSD